MDNKLGSFGSATGGASPELQAAMTARQGNPNAGVLSQVTAGAPTADPAAMVPPPQAPQGAMPQPEMPFQTPESTMIIKALDNRLKALSKKEELEANPVPKF